MDEDEHEITIDPHHQRRDGRMILRAINKGWIGNGRWPTGLTEQTVREAIKQRGGGATLKESAVLATFKLLNQSEARSKSIGARIATVMERQNQIDDQHDIDNPNATPVAPASPIGTQINVQINGDDVEQRRTEVLGILDTLRDRAGTGKPKKAAGRGPKRPAANGGRKAKKSR